MDDATTLQRAEQGISPAAALSEFAAGLHLGAIPEAVRLRAKLSILDALGVGLASSTFDFAEAAVRGATALGGTGPCSVIGRPGGLPLRDAALVNGVMIHGLDFDDTHLASIVHPTAACLPAILSFGEALGSDGATLLAAYAAGMETAIRIGLAADGGFHHTGFHATGVVAHFASAVAAGRLLGLDAAAITAAQGIAASTAAGVQVFLEEGAWTKRFHPGWAAVAGITAAHLAKARFRGPSRPYEGRFGLFETHFQDKAGEVNYAAMLAGLGQDWTLAETALKPYPVCHFIHGCADAAIALHAEIGDEEIVRVEAFLPAKTLPIIAEPEAAKKNVQNEYDAKFSAPFVVATCLLRGRFGLPELTDEALADEAVRALGRKVTCRADPDTAFPTYFSGGVTVHLKSGRVLRRHERINSGAGERMLDTEGVSVKFRASAGMAVEASQAEAIRACVLDLESRGAAELASLLRHPAI